MYLLSEAMPHFLKRSAWWASLLLLAAAAAPTRSMADTVRTVLFFGDSLTAGYGLSDPDSEAFPAQVQALADADHVLLHVINAGLSGETSAGGLRRLDWVLKGTPDVIVLELGANDGLRGTALDVIEKNLQELIERVRKRSPGTRVVLAGMRMPENMGQDYAAGFAAIYPTLAKRNSCELIPFLLEGVGGKSELNQGDQIHPTAEGARIVAATVWRTLKPLLLAGSPRPTSGT